MIIILFIKFVTKLQHIFRIDKHKAYIINIISLLTFAEAQCPITLSPHPHAVSGVEIMEFNHSILK